MSVTPRYRELMAPLPPDRPSCGLFLASLLAEAAYFHYDGATYEAVRDYLGLESLNWYETPELLTVNYVLGIAPDAIIVAFSGTENWGQLLTYSGCSFLQPDPVSQVGFLHYGFRGIASDAYADLWARLTSEQRRRPITIIGHSLGGAVAQIISYWQQFIFQLPVVQFITFGSPAIGGDEVNSILDRIPKVMMRNDGDIVPYLPPGFGLVAKITIRVPILYWLYRYRRVEPQLVCSPGNIFELKNFPPGEKGWVGILILIEHFLDPFNPAPDVSAAVVNDSYAQHSMLVYMGNIYSGLIALGSTEDQLCLTPFVRTLYSRFISLHQDPQAQHLLPDAQFASLLQGLNLPPEAITPVPNPLDVHTIFEDWLAGSRNDVTLRIGLFTNPLPATVPDPASFVEPTFVGYRSFDNDVLTYRTSTPGQSARTTSGYLTWHVDQDGNSPDVLGLFVLMSIPGRSFVLAVDLFPAAARLRLKNDCLGLSVDVWSLRRIFTPGVQATKADDVTAQAAATAGPQEDYGQMFINTRFLPCSGTSTNAQRLIFNDVWPPAGGIAPYSGGSGGLRTWWLFRGKDREMISKALQCLDGIRKRDANLKADQQPILPTDNVVARQAVDQLIDYLGVMLQLARFD